MLVGNSSRALEIDAAVVDIGKVAIRSWAEVVRLLPTIHQVLLDADAQVPVRPRDVHQLGEGVHPAQVVHLGQVLQLPSRLPIRCRFVDRVEKSRRLVQLALWLKLLCKLLRLELLRWESLWLRFCPERLRLLWNLLLLKLLRLECCE